MTTKTNSPYRINLVIDEKMAEILAFLHACNPLLKDSEHIYLAVGESYVRRLRDLPVDYLSEEEDESLANSLKSKSKKKPSFALPKISPALTSPTPSKGL